MRSKSKRNEEKRVESAVRPKGMVAPVGRKTSRNSVYIFAASVFLIVAGAILAALWSMLTSTVVIVAVMAGAVAAFSIRIAPQWERVVVLRLGNFNRIAGPGLYFVVPVVEHATAHIDQRMITTPFTAEEALTADLVPLDIDAVLFWMVFSAKKACVEVEDYSAAVAWVAQTAMRKAIGRATVAEVAMRRDQLDAELKDAIEEKLSPWGIDIIDVEVRDIVVPKELQEAMAMEAVAERKKNARMVLVEAEKDISEMLKDASEVYAGDQDAMKLRTMHLAYESVEQSGGTLVIPSAFSEGFAPEAGGAATAGRPAAGE